MMNQVKKVFRMLVSFSKWLVFAPNTLYSKIGLDTSLIVGIFFFGVENIKDLKKSLSEKNGFSKFIFGLKEVLILSIAFTGLTLELLVLFFLYLAYYVVLGFVIYIIFSLIFLMKEVILLFTIVLIAVALIYLAKLFLSKKSKVRKEQEIMEISKKVSSTVLEIFTGWGRFFYSFGQVFLMYLGYTGLVAFVVMVVLFPFGIYDYDDCFYIQIFGIDFYANIFFTLLLPLSTFIITQLIVKQEIHVKKFNIHFKSFVEKENFDKYFVSNFPKIMFLSLVGFAYLQGFPFVPKDFMMYMLTGDTEKLYESFQWLAPFIKTEQGITISYPYLLWLSISVFYTINKKHLKLKDIFRLLIQKAVSLISANKKESNT